MTTARRTPRLPRPGRPGLGSSIGWSGAAQAATTITNFAVAPFLIRHLGVDRFGVWALVLSLLVTFADLDGGVGASLARFFAFHSARGDRAGAWRLLVGSLLLFLTLGAVISGAGALAAPQSVDLLSIPTRLHGEATGVLRLLGPLVALALVSNCATSLLQANGRFRGLAAVSLCSNLGYVAGVVLVIEEGGGLRAMLVVTGARYLVSILGGLWLARAHVLVGRPLLPERELLREFRSYAARMQLSGLTNFLNGGVDGLVVAALLPIRYVAVYAVGFQAAAAFRSLPLYAFPPILTRITASFAGGGLSGAVRDSERLQARWLPGALGYGAVTAAAVPFMVQAWVGTEFLQSGVVAAILLLGYSVHVALTAIRTCFVRAIGRPGLETRYSWLSTVLNLGLTVLLASTLGLVGVVAATALALVGGSLYFVVLCRRVADLREPHLPLRWYGGTALAVLVTIGGELAVRLADRGGALGLLLTGVPVLIGLALAGISTFGPVRLRDLLGGAGAAPDLAGVTGGPA